MDGWWDGGGGVGEGGGRCMPYAVQVQMAPASGLCCEYIHIACQASV